MSIHSIYLQDKSIHITQEKHKSINYCYITNLTGYDNVFSIIKYCMPLEIENIFKNNNSKRDTLYIAFTYDEIHNKYYFTINIAQSKDLELSHIEVLRIIGNNADSIINKYHEFSHTTTYTNRILSAVKGEAVTTYPPILIK